MKARPMMDRLEAVFDIVPHAEAIADIGTDHGYLAVELIVRGKAKRVIAGDVHKGPLESAKSYVTSRGLSISLRTVQNRWGFMCYNPRMARPNYANIWWKKDTVLSKKLS